MSCEYRYDDGAYLLGALAPAERAAFERHLEQCPSCRDSLASLAVLPGLLSRLDPSPPVAAPPGLLPRVLAAARTARRQERRRRVLVGAAAAVAALAMATTVGIGVHLFDNVKPTLSAVAPTTPGLSYMAMQGPVSASVTAEIGLIAADNGTVVAVRCRHRGQQGAAGWALWIVVYPRAEDEAEPIGSWVSTPGGETSVTAVTHYSVAQIARIELQNDAHAAIAWFNP